MEIKKEKKMLVLNPEKDDDLKIIEFLKGKKYSQYVRRLIEEDMKKSEKNGELDVILNELKGLITTAKSNNVNEEKE